jgi:hypothetical protein
MMTDPIKFYLVKDKGPANLKSDIDNILDYLGTINDVSLKKGAGKVTISYSPTPLTANITSDKTKGKDTAASTQMTLTCDKADNVTVNLLKLALRNTNYRIFNPLIGSYLVTSPDLLDLTTAKVDPTLSKIFKQYGFTPLFNFQNSLIYYALDKKDKSIHLVNRHLLEYLSSKKTKLKKQDNFSVKVGDNINQFVALFDRSAIPTSYYSALYQKGGLINQSGFDIKKLITDTFITAAYFVFEAEKQTFLQQNSSSFSTHPAMVKKGTSLETHIAKTVKKIAPKAKILAIKVSGQVHFEKDNKDKLIPLLMVSIFLDKVK